MGLNIRIHNITSPNNFILSYKIGGLANCETVETDGFTIYSKDNINGIYPSSLERNYQTEPIVITDITLNNIFFKTFYVKITDVVTGNYRIDMLKVNGLGFYLNCLPENVCDFITDITLISTPTPTPTITIILTPIVTSNLQVTSTPTLTSSSFPSVLIPCDRGPILYDGDGNPSILNITTTSLSFRFDGENIGEIAWRIKNGLTTLRSGIVAPTSSIVNITYTTLPTGMYTFEIQGNDCLSNISSVTFIIENQNITNTFVTITDNRFYFDGYSSEYVSYLDSWGVTAKQTNETLNLTSLAGFDYLSSIGRYEQQPQFLTESYVNWKQNFLSEPSTANNIVTQDNITYYFRPANYTTSLLGNFYDFHLRFPEFTLPNNKIVILQGCPYSESENFEMTKRGVSFVRKGVPNNQRSFFFGDAWLDFVKDVNDNFMALPPAYTGPEEERERFYNMLDPYQMARQLRDTLNVLGILDYGYIMWNYERVLNWDDRLGTWGLVQPRPEDIGKPKRQIFFEEFNRLKPENLLFAPWTKKPIVIYPGWENINLGAIWDGVYGGSVTNLSQLDTLYLNNNITPRDFPNGVNGIAPNAIYQVGFYQVGHRTHLDFIYKHIFEAFINKKLFPNKTIIGTLWHENEAIPSADSFTQDNLVTFDGQTKSFPFKPATSVSYMQSYAAWMTAIADGFDSWDYQEYEESLLAFNNTIGNPVFPSNNMKNIDWAMSSVYSLSINKDILESSTEWNFPINPWLAAKNEAPLVAWKLNSTNDSALVLVMNAYNDDLGLKSVSVNINNVVYNVNYHHKFTSIVRITLTPNCTSGPSLYDGDGNSSILNITPTSLTFRFDGIDITSIKWRIKNGSTVMRNGVSIPTSSIVNITYTTLPTGSYIFEIEGNECFSAVSSSNFQITQTPTPTPTPTPTLTSTQLTISTSFTLVTTTQFNDIPDGPEYYLDSVGNGTTTKYGSIQTPIGFDYYNMVGTRVPNQTSRFGMLTNWTQKLVAIQGTQNNIVQEGNKTYYFRPPNYQTNTSYNMYDFHLTFPEFAPIQGKIVSVQPVPFQDELQAEMVKRGVTHVRRGVPNSKRIVFFMDDWLNDVRDVNGNTMYLPPAYQGLESDRQYFYEMLDPYQMAQQLYGQFQLNQLLDIGIVFWNYERINSWGDTLGTWGNVQPAPQDVGKPKKQIFFEQFSLLKPANNLFLAWAHKPIVISPAWGNENFQAAWDAVHNGTATTPQQLDSVYVANNLTPRTFPNGVSSFYPMDIYHVGFYQVGIKEYQEFLYKHILEAYFNKKMYPTKKVVGTLWTDNETLASTDTNVQTFSLTYYGLTKNVSTKPAASFTYMQSFAAWMTAIADGFDIWEYREFLENQSTWERIDQPQFDFQPPHYPYKSFKGVDWAMSSVYSLKQNEDILLANTNWVFPVSPWLAAGGFFHASTKQPLVAYKLSSSGTEALVLAVDVYNEDMLPKTINVTINGQNQQIKIIYKFTSIVRVQL